MMTSPTGNSAAGFTLVEIVLVSVILAILLAASVPRFQSTARRLKVEHTAFELAQLLRLAHASAVSEGRDVVWIWDAQARRVRIEPLKEPGTILRHADVPIALAITVRQGSEIGSCQCIHFDPAGTSEPSTVTIQAAANQYTITVDEQTSRVTLTVGPLTR